ncbi:hypothetical protein DRJ17_04690 [Candidatus Woesearchaeota archaeon]|nr:MAG: hypothetical protein DRJ17_04690 [Candidatus Woesearchaeota archaeon]
MKIKCCQPLLFPWGRQQHGSHGSRRGPRKERKPFEVYLKEALEAMDDRKGLDTMEGGEKV